MRDKCEKKRNLSVDSKNFSWKWKEVKNRKKRKVSISHKEIKESQIFILPKEDCVYSKYLPLNSLWKQYINDLTNKANSPFEMSSLLLKADLHGAIVKVVKSIIPSLVGIEGIILQETTKTFKIIVPENILKVVPKKKNVFTFVVGGFLVTLHGLFFEKNSQNRMVQKWKQKENFDF